MLLDARNTGVLEPHGLTMLQYDALRVLEGTDGVRLGWLAERLLCDDSTLSRAIAALVDDGRVERRPDPLDGRAALVRLTTEGRAVLRRARSTIDATLDDALGVVPDPTTQRLETALEQVVDALRDDPPED